MHVKKIIDSDATVLAKAAKLFHREIFYHPSKFNGSFYNECQRTAVPNVLITLIG